MKFIIMSTSGKEYWENLDTFKETHHLNGLKDIKEEVDCIEVNSLEEIMSLEKISGEWNDTPIKEIIISFNRYDIPVIEFYDYWRE